MWAAGTGVLVLRARALAGVAVVAVVAVVVLVAAGATARAGLVHPPVASFAAGVNPEAVTVDQATGDVLVVDVGAGAVLKFDSAGSPANFSAVGSNVLDGASGADATPHGAFSFDSDSAAQVAVDNSGGPADGYIYVANLSGAVDVFDSTGTFVGEIDGTAAAPQSGVEVCGVAVDPTGHVYASYFQGHVDKYTPTDANPADDTFVGQLEGVPQPCNVAADGLGNIYASTWSTGPVTKYDSSQVGQPTASGTVLDQRSLAVAVDPSNSDVYVDEGDHVTQYESTGVLIGQSGKGILPGRSFGVAVNESGGAANGDLYASDSTNALVRQFGPPVAITAPDVTIDPPSNVTTSDATFTGTVNPNGTDPLNDTTWHFEYSTDAGNTWTSTPGGDAGTGTSPVGVSDQIDSLLPHQSVKVRLVAENAGGSTISSEQDFDTPTITADAVTQPAEDITPEHASLNATLNAHNAPTTYFFEYGTTTAYGTHIPIGDNGDGGSSSFTAAVQQSLHGLRPGTTYHYRIVAHNQAGTVDGADQAFTTTTPPEPGPPRAGAPGSGILPDNRGWELVSPPDKHGSGVLITSARVRAAATETDTAPMAATFGSLGTFADVHGTGVGNDYMAIRTREPGTNGWTTHGITPIQKPLSFLGLFQVLEAQWQGDFSPDLTQGVVSTWSPLTDAPNVKDVANLYLRTNLRNPGIGAYQLLTDCALCGNTPLPPITDTGQIPRIAGVSADFSHITFLSDQPLLSGAMAGVPNLYEWTAGTLRLAGILPDNACATPPCVAPSSAAGRTAGVGGSGGFALRQSPHTISSDGSRIIFTDLSTGDGQSTGNLYMRINGTSTVQINASEKTLPDAPQPAAFQTASIDGSRVLFTSAEQLTNTPIGGAVALYMYDVQGDAGGHHLTLISVDHEPADDPNGVQGVLGASDDGHYVYFISAGQLVADQPVLTADLGIYEWHDGTTTYIGKLADLNQTADESDSVLPNFWGLAPMTARVTPDGRHLLFQSSTGAGLTGYDSNHHVELYLYSADAHELQCASCRPDGSLAAGDATDMSRTFYGGTTPTSHLSRAVTDDGSRAFFTTTDTLVPQDTNGTADVYEFDSASGTVHLLSSGTDNADSFFMDASASGNDAFFVTRQQLVGWDVDQSYDLYDARVGGGLPEPVSHPGCSGDACHGALLSGSQMAPPSSQTLHGTGNVKARVSRPKPKVLKCRRGFVRKRVRGKVRCVRAPKKHKTKVHRTRRVKRASRARKGR
jgi:hypothetical protein